MFETRNSSLICIKKALLLKHSSNSNIKSRLKLNFKLSERLQKIAKMVPSQYSHIWDCCCDHSLLGCALLSRQAAATLPSHNKLSKNMPCDMESTIHFVDIVPELMADLEHKLQRFYASSPWQTHCLDVAKLPLTQYEGRHLIIIAGVGGDLMIEFIEAINQQHKNLAIDFLLCPVHHQFSLRSKLIELDFSLQDEVLVEDNQRFYEILLVSSRSEKNIKVNGNANIKISPVGDKIWQPLSSTHSSQHSIKQAEIADKYLNKTLNHYQRMLQGFQQSIQQGKAKDVQDIIDAYRAVTLRSEAKPSLTCPR